MRELIRADLPEVFTLRELFGSLVARSSTGFALLAGIGAALIVGDEMRTLMSATLEITRPERAPRPYDLQQILGPAVGILVARIAGGPAGALAYVAYSGSVMALGWLARVLTCARALPDDPIALGLTSFCQFGPLDLLQSAIPLFVGLALGGVAAWYARGSQRPGTNALFESAGAHTLPSLGVAFVLNATGLRPVEVVSQTLVFGSITLFAGLLAGAVIGLRSFTPVRTAAVLLALLIGAWAYPLGISQIRMAAGSDRPEVYLVALPLLDLVTIPLAAWGTVRILRRA